MSKPLLLQVRLWAMVIGGGVSIPFLALDLTVMFLSAHLPLQYRFDILDDMFRSRSCTWYGYGTIHLRRQHFLGEEGYPHVPMAKRSQTKGQIILKWFFDVFHFLQKMNENKYHSSKVEFIRWFFGGNRRHQKPFRNYLTFKWMVPIMNSKVDSINLLCQMILFSSNCQKQSRSHIRKKSRPLQNAQLSKWHPLVCMQFGIFINWSSVFYVQGNVLLI